MKVGIYNIYVGFLYSFMLIVTSFLTYSSIEYIYYEKFEWSVFFSLLFGLFSIPFWGYFFYKFQVVVITKVAIIEIKPFLFKFKRINFNTVGSFKYNSWISSKGYHFVYMEIIDYHKKKIIISQAVFENFENMVNSLHINSGKKIPFKMKDLLLKESKENKGMVNFNLLLLICFLIFIIGTTFSDKIPFSSFHQIAIVINVVLLFASFKRYKKYKLRLRHSK